MTNIKHKGMFGPQDDQLGTQQVILVKVLKQCWAGRQTEVAFGERGGGLSRLGEGSDGVAKDF